MIKQAIRRSSRPTAHSHQRFKKATTIYLKKDFNFSFQDSPWLVSDSSIRARLPNLPTPTFNTSELHSWRGLPTRRTYLPACVCRVLPMKTSRLIALDSGERITLPINSNCRSNTCSDIAATPACLETQRMQECARSVSNTWRKSRQCDAFAPSLAKPC